MLLGHYLSLLHRSQLELADAFRRVGTAHGDEADVRALTTVLADQCDDHAAALDPIAQRYGDEAGPEPDALHAERFAGPRDDPLGLLRDLHDLYLLACECDIAWTLIGQAAQGAHDGELIDVVERCEGETAQQLAWLRSRMKTAAPQTLVVA